MQPSRGRTGGLWKDCARDPSQKHERAQEFLWMDSWNVLEQKLLRLAETEQRCAPKLTCRAEDLRAHQEHRQHRQEAADNSNVASRRTMYNLEELRSFSADGMLSAHVSLDDIAYILQNCRQRKDHTYAQRMYAYMCETGLDKHWLLGNFLVTVLAEVGSMNDAHQVFDNLVDHNEWSWNSLITGYVKCGQPDHALSLYKKMQKQDQVLIDRHSFIAVLKACARKKDLEMGIEIHATISTQRLLKSDPFIGNSLVDMYAKCGLLSKAQEEFDRLQVRDVVSWTALIAGHVENGDGEEALRCFGQMRHEGVVPNAVTFVCILKACGILAAVGMGEEIQVEVERKGLLGQELAVGNSLVDMYGKCGYPNKAEEVLEKLSMRDVISWTSLLKGYVEHGDGERAIECYTQMQMEGVCPNIFTFACTLKACGLMGAIEKGKELHAQIEKNGALERDLVVGNSLVGMYAKWGQPYRAHDIFSKLPIQTVVGWTAIISAYADQGHDKEALHCFECMQTEGISLDSLTFPPILKACGNLKDETKGQKIHAEIERRGFLDKQSVYIGSSLVTMYGKCNSAAKAEEVFNTLPEEDVGAWTALIAAFVDTGNAEEALECFDRLQLKGVLPMVIMFAHSLRACGNLGVVYKGQEIHAQVEKKGLLEEYSLICNALIDMYASLGLLDDASNVLDKLIIWNIPPWNALISAYVEHGRIEEAFYFLERMELKGVPPDASTFVCSLTACGSIRDLEKGHEVHAEIEKRGFVERDIMVGSSLVDMYVNCGSLVIAEHVFNRLPLHDVVSWNALLRGYCKHGLFHEVLTYFEQMLLTNISPDAVTIVYCLRACGSSGAREKGHKLHAEVERMGLLETDSVVGNTLVDMYGKWGALGKARDVFGQLTTRSVVSWTALIAGYSEHGLGEDALWCAEEMQLDNVSPNNITLVCILKACSSAGAMDKAEEIHTEVERKGLLEKDVVLGNALIAVYAKHGSLARAQEVFDRLAVRNACSWTSLIAGYSEHGHDDEAFECFTQMLLDGLSLDAHSLSCSLKACGNVGAAEKAQDIHAELERKGLLGVDVVAGNALVDVYAKCGLLGLARQVFEKLKGKDVVSWNTLITGYTEHGHGEKALECVEQMRSEGLYPDAVTYISILKACKSLGATEKGQAMHAMLERQGLLDNDIAVSNTLIDMYAKLGLFAELEEVLEKLSSRNVVSWTAIITGYAKQDHGEEALACFDKMQHEGVPPNAVTCLCTLKACCSIGAVERGRELHMDILRRGFLEEDQVGNTLVCMYAKCGLIADAHHVLAKLSVRDIVSWNAMIAGYSHLGESESVFRTFDKLLQIGIEPSMVTFVIVLSTCSRTRLLDRCLTYVETMNTKFDIALSIEHATSVVNLLCRVGQADNALAILSKVPFGPNLVAWRSMLSVCKESGNVELGRHAFVRAMNLDENDAVAYVLMSQICASEYEPDGSRSPMLEKQAASRLKYLLVD